MLGKRGRDEREEDDDYDAPEGAGPTTAPEELLKAVPEEAPDPAASKSEQGEEKEKMKELERQRQLAIMDKLNKKQLERYEHFRRAGFKKAAMKRLVTSLTGSKASEQVAVSMMGVAKIFVGELVETARVVMVQWGDKGATRPEHIREAYRRLKRDGKVPSRRQQKRLLKR